MNLGASRCASGWARQILKFATVLRFLRILIFERFLNNFDHPDFALKDKNLHRKLHSVRIVASDVSGRLGLFQGVVGEGVRGIGDRRRGEGRSAGSSVGQCGVEEVLWAGVSGKCGACVQGKVVRGWRESTTPL